MKKDIRIYIHSRGNHTPYQIRHYGTSDTMRDYIAEQMADVFALDCTENPDSPKWFYW